LKRLLLARVSAQLPDCGEFTGAAVGVNAKELLGTVHLAEVHWYEATGIGRKEFKIKNLL
jgi:hypothetical protein